MFDCDDYFTYESDKSLPPSPIYDRYQSRDGYHAVPPPYTGIFMPPKPNLVFHDTPNVNETAHTAFNVKLSPTKPDKDLSHTHRPLTPIIEDWVSDSEDDSETKIPPDGPTISKPNNNGTRRNRKACLVCKSLDHLIKDCNFYEKKMAQTPARNHVQRGNHQQYASMTLTNPQKHVVPTTVLTKSKLDPITAARPVTTTVSKSHVTRPRQKKPIVTKPHSPPRRHINYIPSPKASNFPLKVTAVKVPHGNLQHALKEKEVIDSGCSWHMTGNMSYLSDFEELNGRYVAFGGNPKGGKISGKGEIKTGKLDFDDVYFVKELKFNLFSVSQMCDKKHNVLFTDTECLVLSPEFELPDENQVMLRVPRENNMYNFRGMKGIKREFSVPRTPQQNGIAERKNRTLIEAARTMLADSLLPIPFWAEFDEGFLVGYFVSSKAYRVFNSGTLIVQETLHINFLENRPNFAGNQSNPSAGVQDNFDAKKEREESVQQYMLFPVWSFGSTNPQNTDDDAAFEVKVLEFEGRKHEFEVHVSPSSNAQSKKHDDKTKREAKGKSPVESSTRYINLSAEVEDFSYNSINEVNAADFPVLAVGIGRHYLFDDEEDVGAEADFTNLETSITVSPIPTTRVHKDHHEELLQFKMQKVWVLVDLPHGKRAIDVKSAFLYRTIEEEVYVCQPPGFEDPDYPDKVYKVVKALYGLHQAPRAWYETLANYLLENGFQRGKIDQTLFIIRQKGDILLVQIYVDDIIFGSTDKDMCKAFEKLMKDKFQMSSMGELTFFLGLQVKQKKDGIFISQDIYVAEILRKFSLTDGKSASIPIDTKKPLLKDSDGEDVDVHTYRSMIGSLMYLTSSRPDIMFAVYACACFQVTPKTSHLHAVKRIFRYLKGKPHLGLWYPKDSPFSLMAYSDSDYAGASLDKKSTTGGYQTVSGKDSSNPLMADNLPKVVWYSTHHVALMKSWLVQKQTALGKDESNPFIVDSLLKTICPSLQKKVVITAATIRDALRLDDAEGKGCSRVETPLFEGMIVAPQAVEGAAEGNVDDVPAAGVAIEGTASVNVDDVPAAVDEPSIPSPTPPTQPPPPSQDIPSTSQVQPTPPPSPIAQSLRVENLEQDKIAQALEITKLKQRVKKLERRNRLKVSKLRRLKKGRMIANMDAHVDVTLKNVVDISKEVAVDAEIKESDDEVEPTELQEAVEVVTTAKLITEVVIAASVTITAAALQLTIVVAPTLTTAPSTARRIKGVVIRDPEETATPSTIIHSEAKSKDKDKGILSIKAELNKNIDWDEVIDHVQRKEKEDNALMRYQALKRKPQTEAQARKNMMIYLRNMAGFKIDYFKGMNYDATRPIFEKYFKSNVAFLEKKKEQMEEEDNRALKRISESQEDKSAKKQKLDEEVAELKRHL
nr:uncharacterized mitochondrial protein AtMg00810-like [Tanacetum cinerariifolium]